MRIHNSYLAIIISIVTGIVAGYIGGPVFILIPWGILGLGIGYFSARRKVALVNGVLYGFSAAYVFMVHGYAGAEPLSTRLLPFVVLGLVGALCGAILTYAGNVFHRNPER